MPAVLLWQALFVGQGIVEVIFLEVPGHHVIEFSRADWCW
jgi:hypothetical protein